MIIADHIGTDDRLQEHGLALGHVPLDGEDDLYSRRGTDAETTLVTLLDTLDVDDLLRTAGAAPDEVEQLRARLVG